MDNFFSEFFFNTKDYEHKDIFSKDKLVWKALFFLNAYLKKNIRLGKIEGKVSKRAYIINPELISIGEGTVVESGAYIKGPCIIGKNCIIKHGAYVRDNVITGDSCIIGHCTEIKNSILLNNVCAAHFAYIGDSIIGNNVNLGAGVRCANFKLFDKKNKKSISFFFEGKKVNTNLGKLGAIIADNVQIGCNTVLNPATFIGKNSICYASINLSGVIDNYSIVKPSSKNLIIKTIKSRK